MKAGFGLLALGLAVCALAVVGTGSVAGAEGTQWADENNTSVSPGHHLAGAVGAQGATVEGELWNRSLSERLADADTPGERAEVLADEITTVGRYVEALEAARENLTASWAAGELSEGEYRASLSEFVTRARGVERRGDRTVRAAEELSFETRERYGVNLTRAENLTVRARELYRFDGEVGEDVVDETLENETVEVGTPLSAEPDRE